MERADIIRLFGQISVWKRGSQRAPHKPLLLLYAIAKCARGEGRQIPFREVDEALRPLLVEFGPPRKSYHTEYPFGACRMTEYGSSRKMIGLSFGKAARMQRNQ